MALQVLGLNSTKVSGTLPPEWASNATANRLGSSLQELYLHSNMLQGEIRRAWWTGFPNVTRFTIWSTNVCGLHPEGGLGLGALCLDTAGTRFGESLLSQACEGSTAAGTPVASCPAEGLLLDSVPTAQS